MNGFISSQPKDSFFRKQFEALDCESVVLDYESEDPLFEDKYKVTPFLIHRYRNRVLFLTTKFCASYCRHCFRKNILPSLDEPCLEDFIEAANYVKMHNEVEEVLFSGGDPLTLSPKKLSDIISFFDLPNRDLRFRICSRVPIVAPYLFSDELLDIFNKFDSSRVRFSIHINHLDEITFEFKDVLKKLQKLGFEVLSQTVLLKGINDNVEALSDLFLCFSSLGIKPYYLFQGDLARNTKCYRVPIQESICLYDRLKSILSDDLLPVFAVDLPGGGGKVPIKEPFFLGFDESYALFKDVEGMFYKYPLE